MKTKMYALAVAGLLAGCTTLDRGTSNQEPVRTTIDLLNVNQDKVQVVMRFPPLKKSKIEFRIPKIVPGTYSTDNYGRFIEDFQALDKEGKPLKFSKIDDNIWQISHAKYLDKITYKVNDTYDIAKEGGVFSPAGTNIEKDKNFMLNLHGFVGYIAELQNHPYAMEIYRPNALYPGTALKFSTQNSTGNSAIDHYKLSRYFEVTDNPIMYAAPDSITFKTDGMEILLNLYSATGRYKAEDFREALVKTMTAQKAFLGKIDNTDKYAVLLYLSDDNKLDARGAGALEHNNSTTVVFSESVSKEKLEQSLIDVVSHEFFHILTPLNVHSKEIHDFDYNNPKMSKHLWMYEGVTEYFANLFQINQGLCDEDDFYNRMTEKINISKNYDDTVPFTFMSKNILTDEHKDSFYNVYQKGALIGMCLDIQLRELSNGKSGILDLMRNLSSRYGKDQPFDDDRIIKEIVQLTGPEINTFFKSYVEGKTPIPYQKYLAKVGLELQNTTVPTDYLFKNKVPYIDIDKDSGQIYFRRRTQLNSFLESMGVKGNDVLKAINGTAITQANYREPILATNQWKPGMEVSFLIERNGKEILLKGKTIAPTERVWKITDKKPAAQSPEFRLRSQWLKG